MSRKFLNLIWLLLVAACAPETETAQSAATNSAAGVTAEGASHVFLGSHIITMTDQKPQPTALAVTGEEIVWMGDRAKADAWIGTGTQVHELGERALLPGFIDAHGHLTYLAATLGWANLASPPVGPVTDIASLQTTLRAHLAATAAAPGAWVIGQGYDDSLMAEQRHPTRQELDAVSNQHPIALLHVSGHLLAANSAALAAAGINAETPNPPGGHIRREAGSETPNGVLEETATYPLRAVLMQPSADPLADLRHALSIYASHGITTAQDGAISPPAVELLETAANLGQLSLDVVVYPVAQNLESADAMAYPFGPYRNRLRYGGVKLVLDGSPQGKTAYLSRPYAVPPHGQNADYHGYPTFPAATVNAMVASLMERDIPVLAHANGDAAAQQLIDAVAAAPGRAGRDHRTVMIHAQTVRDDQLDQMLELGMMPSFFSAHTFYWGDW
ncbi:MAG: amidohydrolase family protein, partial [Pseudomonadales bacterium]|nr:amidohydrolase family protein [Pseudomonadales bacterium]